MFILRQVLDSGSIYNTSLGGFYEITRKELEPERFDKVAKATDWDADNVFAFLFCDEGGVMCTHPLYRDRHYYIMTESGKTFEKIYQ